MYENMTYNSILRELLEQVQGPVSTEEGSLIRTAVSPAAFEIEKCYIELDVMLREIFADTASMEYLRRIGIEHGVFPYQAGCTVAKGRFDREVPRGSRFSIGKYHYVSGEKISGTELEYELTCEEPGSGPNLLLGELTPLDYIEGLEMAELTEILEPGNDDEEAEHFRRRFLSVVRRPSTSGNVYDYYNWALECEGVGAVKVFPLVEGPGTVKVVITNSDQAAASEVLIGKVRDHIEELRPVGAAVTITSAVEKKVNAAAKIKLEKGLNLGAVQEDFAKAFDEMLKINAFNSSYVSLAKVGNLLLSMTGVEDFTDLTMNGNMKNVELGDDEIAVAGIVSLEVM